MPAPLMISAASSFLTISFSRSASTAAASTAKLGFRNSEGWRVRKPNSIERRAPKASWPANNAIADPITAAMKMMVAEILMLRSESVEVAARTITAIAAKAICLAA